MDGNTSEPVYTAFANTNNHQMINSIHMINFSWSKSVPVISQNSLLKDTVPCYPDEHANFQGYSLPLSQTDENLCDNPLDSTQPPVNPCFSAPSWNDVASSIKVMPGYQVWLYLHSKSQEQELGEYYIYRSCNSEISDFSSPPAIFRLGHP
jgi:hypothetical protein